MRRTMTGLIAALILACAACSKDRDNPAPSPAPTPLDPGTARLTPESSTAAPNATVKVYLDVATGSSALGALGAKVTFDAAAFQFISVSGVDAQLGAPTRQAQPATGTLYLAWLNSSPPDTGITGERRVAEITFRAIGSAGASMNLGGSVSSFGDTQFMSQDIGSGAFPRTMQVTSDVVVGG